MKRLPIVAMILMALLAAGCTTPQQPPIGPPTSGPNTPSVATSDTTVPTTPTAPPATAVVVKVYFALDADRMQPFLRELPAGTKATLKGGLLELLKGPNGPETSAGFSTAIPVGTVLRSVKMSGTTAIIDLSSKYAADGGAAAVFIRLDQVVYTATQFSTVKKVRFLIGGKTVKVFTGEGVMLDRLQTRAGADYAIPPIFVDNPAWMATVKKGSVARGTADVFEAVFHLQLRDVAGKLLVNKTVHASSGTGTRGTWSLKLAWGTATPGVGELRVFASSAKNGAEIDEITIPVTISD
ncbi:MAG TPA: GerMN domain-containing protein [Coriobacteriia bacterium]